MNFNIVENIVNNNHFAISNLLQYFIKIENLKWKLFVKPSPYLLLSILYIFDKNNNFLLWPYFSLSLYSWTNFKNINKKWKTRYNKINELSSSKNTLKKIPKRILKRIPNLYISDCFWTGFETFEKNESNRSSSSENHNEFSYTITINVENIFIFKPFLIYTL